MLTQHEHIVKSFDSELERLYGEITRMGEIATAQLDAAARALESRIHAMLFSEAVEEATVTSPAVHV